MKLVRFSPTSNRVLVEYEHAGEEGWYQIPVGEAEALKRQLEQAIRDVRDAREAKR